MNSRYPTDPTLQLALRAGNVGLWDWDISQNTTVASDVAKRQLGLQPGDDIAAFDHWQHRLHPADWEQLHSRLARYLAEPDGVFEAEYRIRHQDGTWRWILGQGELIKDEGGQPIRMVGCSIDISNRKRVEADSARHFRALQIVSKSNLALVQAVNETAYLKEVCRIAVEDGGYRMAWIGCAEQDEQRTVRPVAWAGIEDGYLDTVAVRWADCERGRGPMGTAIRTQQPSIIRDVQNNPAFAPWREAAIRRGYQSVLGLPLVCGGETYGGLTVYSGDVDAFNDGELAILKELAQNVGFGMSVVRSRVEQARTTQALKESERRLAEAQRVAHLGYWERDLTANRILFSEEVYRIFGRDPSFTICDEAELQAMIHPADRDMQAHALQQAIQGKARYDVVYRIKRTDGEVRFLHSQGDVNTTIAQRPTRMFGTIQDISDRKQIEEALRESERRLAEAQRIAHVGHWERDLRNDRVVWSDEIYRIFGLTCDKRFMLADIQQLIHPEDQLVRAKAITEAIQSGGAFDTEYRIIRPDGEVRFVRSQGEVRRDELGQPWCMFGTIQDISDRKLAEQALQASERRLAEAQRIAHVGDWDYDVKTDVITWSEEAYRIFGRYPREQVAALTEFQKLIHPEDRAGRAQAIGKAIATYSIYDHEHRVIRPDGEVRYIHCRGVVTRDETGRPDHVIGTVQDVTERRQAEEALRRSTEIQRRALEIALVSGFVYEVASGTVLFTEQAAGMYGLPSSISLENAWKLIHPDDLPHVQAAWRASLAGALYNVEYRVVLHGQNRWINARAKPETDDEGRVIRIIGVLQDVTDRRQLEDQLRHAQKMEAVGQLAAGIAHDFNNLLTVIIGYTYMLLRRLKPEDPLRTPVMESYKAAEQAAALTRQLLAFSRQQVLEPKVLSLGTILADTEEMLRVIVGDGMRVQMHCDPEAGFVRVDPAQIQQVLINLTTNARDAMPEGGVLYLGTSKATVTADDCRSHAGLKPGVYSVLTVTDSGKGMDKETLAHLFEPFFTTKAPGRGTGLGMAVVYGIVNQSRGYIEVFSQPGQGTTFNIYFPLVDEVGVPQVSQLGVASSEALPTGRETVLLVEDEEAVRTLARNVLRSSGYTVLEASNGLDAIKLAQSHSSPIDLVVSDVVMPYLGGRPLAERLLGLLPKVKVLFISGHTDATVERHGVRETEFPFLEKPFTPLALAQKVREVLDTTCKVGSPNLSKAGN